MAFFRKPQEKKGSAVQAEAQKGKKAMSGGFGFFGRKNKEEEPIKKVEDKGAGEDKKETKAPAKEKFGLASGVILRPRVTEKGSDLASHSNAYVFDVHPSANKVQIAAGVKELYGVEPVKVHVVKVPSKRVRSRRGERGVKSGGKKAYVYLKKGDTIEFV